MSRSLNSIIKIIEGLELPSEVKKDVVAVYKIIADAESKAHGVPVADVHFHEVGTLDAIVDIAATSLIIRYLKPDKILASPVCTGRGTVKTEHGILPVPAPATAYILEGIPSYQGEINSELCTPTGAALLKYFVDEFGPQPEMIVEKIGYGFGSKDFDTLNAVRSFYGEMKSTRDVLVIECTIDDMTGEEIGFAVTELLEGDVLDAYTTPVMMKKNRPGTLLTAIVSRDDLDSVLSEIFRLTTTLGVRIIEAERATLEREIITENGVRKKVSHGYGAVEEKYEYDDLVEIAKERGISLREALEYVKSLE